MILPIDFFKLLHNRFDQCIVQDRIQVTYEYCTQIEWVVTSS